MGLPKRLKGFLNKARKRSKEQPAPPRLAQWYLYQEGGLIYSEDILGEGVGSECIYTRALVTGDELVWVNQYVEKTHASGEGAEVLISEARRILRAAEESQGFMAGGWEWSFGAWTVSAEIDGDIRRFHGTFEIFHGGQRILTVRVQGGACA